MSFFDELLGKLGFSDNGDEEPEQETIDENDDEEEEDDEEERGSLFGGFGVPFFSRRNHAQQGADDEEEEDDEDEEETPRASERSKSTSRQGKVIDYSKNQKERKAKQPDARQQHCERIVVVRQISDSRAIITHLHHGDSVFLNLENIDPKDCGRVIDLLSGAAFALGGTITKVSRLTYLLAPSSVDVVPPQTVHASSRYTL